MSELKRNEKAKIEAEAKLITLTVKKIVITEMLEQIDKEIAAHEATEMLEQIVKETAHEATPF